jgi:hypothetical protein
VNLYDKNIMNVRTMAVHKAYLSRPGGFEESAHTACGLVFPEENYDFQVVRNAITCHECLRKVAQLVEQLFDLDIEPIMQHSHPIPEGGYAFDG